MLAPLFPTASIGKKSGSSIWKSSSKRPSQELVSEFKAGSYPRSRSSCCHYWSSTNRAASRLVNELAQITTRREFTMDVPAVSNAVGETNGFLLAYNISSGRRSRVLMNIGGNMGRDISGPFGVTGENSSRKST